MPLVFHPKYCDFSLRDGVDHTVRNQSDWNRHLRQKRLDLTDRIAPSVAVDSPLSSANVSSSTANIDSEFGPSSPIEEDNFRPLPASQHLGDSIGNTPSTGEYAASDLPD
jgi:hypothetical protein